MSKKHAMATMMAIGLTGAGGAIYLYPERAEFKSLAEIRSHPELVAKIRAELYGHQATVGEPADDKDAATSAFLREVNGIARPCSLVLVGPQVALTAAHCVNQSQRIEAFSVTGTCTEPAHAKTCSNDSSGLDLAICFLDEPVQSERYQTISQQNPKTTDPAIARGLGGPLDAPVPIPDAVNAAATVTSVDSACVRMTTTPKSMVCKGDSGGGVFGPDGKLFGLISHAECKTSGTVYVSSLATEAAIQFIKKWQEQADGEKKAQRKICGFDLNDPKCHA